MLPHGLQIAVTWQGDLFRHVSRTGPMTEVAAVHTVLLPTLRALDHLHAQVPQSYLVPP